MSRIYVRAPAWSILFIAAANILFLCSVTALKGREMKSRWSVMLPVEIVRCDCLDRCLFFLLYMCGLLASDMSTLTMVEDFLTSIPPLSILVRSEFSLTKPPYFQFRVPAGLSFLRVSALSASFRCLVAARVSRSHSVRPSNVQAGYLVAASGTTRLR